MYHFLMRFVQLVTAILVSMFIFPFTLHAQTAPAGHGLSFHIGALLPTGLTPQDDLMSGVGGRYIFPMGGVALESGYTGSNSGGIKYQNFDLSIRADIPFQDMFIFGVVGPDLLRLKRPGAEDYLYYVGGHVGGGLLAHLADTLFLKLEMRFNFQPGTVLFFGCGFEYRFGG